MPCDLSLLGAAEVGNPSRKILLAQGEVLIENQRFLQHKTQRE